MVNRTAQYSGQSLNRPSWQLLTTEEMGRADRLAAAAGCRA